MRDLKVRKLLIYLVLIAIIVMSAVQYYFKSYVGQWSNNIYPLSYIGGLNVSGKTKEQARQMLNEHIKVFFNKNIDITYGNNKYTLAFRDLDLYFNIDEKLNNAFNFGKSGNLLNRYKNIKSVENKNYDLKMGFNSDKVKAFIKNLSNYINREPVNAAITINKEGKIDFTKDIKGYKLDEDYLYGNIVSNIVYEPRREVTISAKVDEITANITYEKIKDINSIVSSYSTNFAVSNSGRADNIKIAVNKVNGTLLLPGEEFSFNKATGMRTLENGFKIAPVIINSKLQDGVAGGVCQVSTTLYNSIIRLNIRSIQRMNHSLAPAYIQPGFDATVSEHIDYKFKNSLKYPIYIEGFTKNNKVVFNVYSNSSLKDIKYELVNEIYEEQQPEVVVNKVKNLPMGTIEKIQEGHVGYKVNVYIVGYSNGKEISKKLISKDKYKKVDEIYNVSE